MPSLLSPPPPSPNKLQKKRSAESTRNWFGKSSSTSSTAGSASSTPSTSSAHSHQSHRSHQRNASVVTAGSGSGSGSGIPRPKSAYSASGSYEGSVGSYGSYGGSYVSERGVKAGKGAKKEKAQEEANNSLDSIETAGIGTIRRHPNPQPHAYSHPHPHPPHPQRQLTASTSSTTVTQGTVSTSRSGSLKYGERYKRVRPLFCDVVVEGMRVGDGGWEIPDATSLLLPYLGSSLPPLRRLSRALSSHPLPSSLSSMPQKTARHNPQALSSRLRELVDTERSYVRRLGNYALPLRTFAKDKNSLIIPPFEARVLFGNVEALLGLNEQFLGVLEGMRVGEEVERGAGVEWAGIIKDWMSRFSVPYTSYLSSYPQAKGIENSLMATTSQWRSGFSRFCEKTKMQTSGNGAGGIGNVGLRELLMEPIQRIPRYRLLMDEMLKHLDPHDSRRRELEDAIEIATKIANCDLDEETFRAN
ncbi:Dbl homology domain-containing protein, partial [Atractiella rhizophila]